LLCWSRDFRLRSLWCWCAWFVSHNQPLYQIVSLTSLPDNTRLPKNGAKRGNE
jgi:hypothetical protein